MSPADRARDGTGRRPSGGPNGPRRAPRLPGLLTAALLSSLCSTLTIRLASPFTIDDMPSAVVLLVVAPLLLVLLAELRRPLAGIVVACALPFVWLWVIRSPGDSAALWFIPVGCVVALSALSRASPRPGASAAATGAAASLLALSLLWPQPQAQAGGTSTVLIGIDGASWQCVDEAVAAGRMPNIERLMETGHRARLRSLPSMLSPQVWSAIATGCPPDVNGIYGWAQSQSDFRVGRVWDRMWMDGRSVGTCGWYFTWPPAEFLSQRDFVVPSTLAPTSACVPPDCCFFRELWAGQSGLAKSNASTASCALRALRGGVRLSTIRRGILTLISRSDGGPLDIDSAWKRRSVSAALQSDMFAELLRSRRPELGVVLFNQVDKVSHLYWKYKEPELFPDVTPEQAAEYGAAIGALYAEADRCVGKVLGAISPDANVIIVSDHGFRPALRKIMGRFCRIRTEQLIDALDSQEVVLGSNLDQVVHLEMVSGAPDERRERLLRLERVLKEAHVVGEDAGVFTVAREGDVLRLEIAPRDQVPETASIVLDGREYRFDSLVAARLEARFSGEHAPDGVYLLAGPMAAHAAQTDSLSVLDVAPTVAAILGQPLSRLWTGRPALDEETRAPLLKYAEYAPPAAVSASRDTSSNESLKEVLRSLGYLE